MNVQPEFVPGEAGNAPVESNCHSAWNGIRRGDSRVDSTNRTHFLLPVGTTRPAAIERAFEALAAMHPILACRVEERGGAPWLVRDIVPRIEWAHVAGADTCERPKVAETAVGEIVWRRFRPDCEPLSRPFVVFTGEGAAWFGLVVHHFVADAFSIGILLKDFLRFLRVTVAGTALPAIMPDVRYQDYLFGLHRWIGSESGMVRRTAVAERVAGFPRLSFAATDTAVSEERFLFDPFVATHVGNMAKALRTTSYTILLAAQAAVLSAMARSNVIAMKIITSGRDASSLLQTVGNLADRQFLRIDLHGDPSFIDLVHRAKAALSICRRDAFVRADFLQADLHARGIDVAAPVLNYRSIRQRLGGTLAPQPSLRVPPVDGDRTLPRDIYYLELIDYPGGISGTIRYGAGRLPGLLAWFEAFIAAAFQSPNETLSSLLRQSEPSA